MQNWHWGELWNGLHDCQPFDEEEIGMEKYFVRTYFVRHDRNTNMAIFDHAVNEPKKLLNTIQDLKYEEGMR